MNKQQLIEQLENLMLGLRDDTMVEFLLEAHPAEEGPGWDVYTSIRWSDGAVSVIQSTDKQRGDVDADS